MRRHRDFAGRIADVSTIGLITLKEIELFVSKSAHLNRDDGVSHERGDKNGRPWPWQRRFG